VVSANSSSVVAGAGVTITAQLATSSGTPVATSGKVVIWSKNGAGGSFGAATSVTNAAGVATVTFTAGTTAGTDYTVTATDNTSLTGTGGTIATTPGPASAATTTISAAPQSLLANGTSSATVTVQAKDAYGNNLTQSDGTVALSATAGTLSAVTNGGNGTYAATLTAPTSPGTATVSGTVGGRAITSTATVTFQALAAHHLRFSSASTNLAAGGTMTLTVRVEDANDNLVAGDSGRTISFAQSAGSGSVSRLGTATTSDGNASITTTGTGAGPVTITASAAGLTPASSSFSVVADTATTIRFTNPTGSLTSGSARVFTVELRDASGNLTAAASPVTFTQTSGSGTVSGFGSKTSTAGVASVTIVGQLAGPITVTASSNALSAVTTFSVVPGPADASSSTLTRAPGSIPGNGAAVSTITLHVKDAAGNALTTSAGAVALRATNGRLSAVTDLHNGTYTASLTAGTRPGKALVTGELDGQAIGGQATVTVKAQCIVPRVRGKALRVAKDALRIAHCGVGSVKTTRSATVAAGKVIAQSRAAGRMLAPNTKVKLTVSRGRRR
jgi:invasin-like protein/PASTA domain-containing protein/Big-like domain-containing protein